MTNNQRGAVRGAVIQGSSKSQHSKQPRNTQMNAQHRVAGPHINQHSAYLQRAAQAKMAQLPAAHRPVVQAKSKSSVQMARPPAVVQRACLFNGLAACWNSIFGSSSPRENYQPIQDERREVRHETPVTSHKVSRTEGVDEGQTVTRLPYGTSVVSNLISSCAFVILCHDNDFDCYHPSGGHFYSNSRIRSNPNRIFYVYKALKGDKPETVDDYKRYAQQYQKAVGGNPPLTVYGQLNGNADIWVKVVSETSIQPVGGSFRT